MRYHNNSCLNLKIHNALFFCGFFISLDGLSSYWLLNWGEKNIGDSNDFKFYKGGHSPSFLGFYFVTGSDLARRMKHNRGGSGFGYKNMHGHSDPCVRDVVALCISPLLPRSPWFDLLALQVRLRGHDLPLLPPFRVVARVAAMRVQHVRSRHVQWIQGESALESVTSTRATRVLSCRHERRLSRIGQGRFVSPGLQLGGRNHGGTPLCGWDWFKVWGMGISDWARSITVTKSVSFFSMWE